MVKYSCFLIILNNSYYGKSEKQNLCLSLSHLLLSLSFLLSEIASVLTQLVEPKKTRNHSSFLSSFIPRSSSS